MAISLTCKRCGAQITANNEDKLVTRAQEHARKHGHPAALTRQHILARVHNARQEADLKSL